MIGLENEEIRSPLGGLGKLFNFSVYHSSLVPATAKDIIRHSISNKPPCISSPFIRDAVLKSGRVLFEVKAGYSIISAPGYIPRWRGTYSRMHAPELIQLAHGGNEHTRTRGAHAHVGPLTRQKFHI